MKDETIATRTDACNVCSGSLTIEEARAKPGSVTCSTHFLELLDDPYQRASRTCSSCGWPASRTVPECEGHPVVGGTVRYY